MISPTYATVTTTRHEFRIPSPACQRDIQDTFIIAEREFRKMNNIPQERALYDNTLNVEAYDDELVVFFTVKEAA